MKSRARCVRTGMTATLIKVLAATAMSGTGPLVHDAWAASLPAATAAQTSSQTRYPIVLVHGLWGFENIAGLDYFYQIPQAMRASGATVFVASVSQVNTNEVRGEQLLKQMREWAAAKGYKKFNLVGHSQGGPTARYVAAVAPELVASVTSVGSPHFLPPGPRTDLISKISSNWPWFAGGLGTLEAVLSLKPTLPQDPKAFAAYWTDGTEFNRRFPQGMPTPQCGVGPEVVHGVRYYSVAGNAVKTNGWDATDAIHQTFSEPSDGVVLKCATHWGKVLRDDYPWNHFDQVNQMMGLIGKGAPDPVAFYATQANRLKGLGL